jgi:hypothetical protein
MPRPPSDGHPGERQEDSSDKKGLSTTVLKPIAPRLAETSWPTRPRFARGAGIAAGAEKTPESPTAIESDRSD